ncbi:MAG: AEC family transporter [Candidatus Thorarchaeota archaeon]
MQALDLALRMGFFYVFILLGFAIAQKTSRADHLAKVSTSLIINLFLPILILQSLLATPASAFTELPTVIMLGLLTHLLGFALLLVVYRRRTVDKAKRGALLLCVTFNNAMFLPIPLVLMFIGDAGIAIVTIFAIIQMALFVTLGSFIGATYGGGAPDLKSIVRKAALFPPFLAAGLAVVLFALGFTLPTEVTSVLEYNSTVTTYLALFVVGLGVGTSFSLSGLRSALEVISIRQVLVPAIIGAVLLVSGLSNLTARVILLEALMPPAVLTVTYANGFKLDAKTAATTVTVGTLLFMPLVLFLPLIIG